MEYGVFKLILLAALIWIFGSNLASINRKFTLAPQQEETREVLNEEVKKYEQSVVTVIGYKSGSNNSSNQNPLSELLNFPYFSGLYMTMGTGFVVSSEGAILTNKHVVDDTSANYRVTLNNGKRYTVTDIYRDPNNDVALLKITPSNDEKEQLKPLDLGDSTKIKTGDTVATIGTDPKNYRKEIKVGKISGVGYKVIADNPYQNERERLNNVIQTNLNLVPGNSGSPLLNSDGKVVGINTATASSISNVSFAIPINPVKQFMENVNK